LALSNLSNLDIINGTFTTLANLIGIFVGIIIAWKYVEYKRRELLTVGISLAFGSVVYWSSSITFFLIILYNYEPGLVFHLSFHLLVPLGLLFWMYSFAILVYPKSVKKIMLIFGIICALYDIFLLYFLLTDPQSLGRRTGKITGEAYLYISSFLLFVIVALLITMSIFIHRCFRSEDSKIKWRGKFLLISMIIGVFSGLIGMFFPDTALIIILTRTLRVISSIISYFGWLLPERIAKLVIKEQQEI
jgi:hypothetical protein